VIDAEPLIPAGCGVAGRYRDDAHGRDSLRPVVRLAECKVGADG
jgi:hypothetical protein